jgi:hypothetical protein
LLELKGEIEMKKRVLAAVAVLVTLALLAVGASATDGDLVVNGDFEIPTVTSSYKWDIFDSGTSGLEWTVEWAGTYSGAPDPAHLELHRGVNNWQPYEGFQHAELDTDWGGPGHSQSGEPASVKIYQDLQTCPGGTYELKYAWSPRPGHADNGLEVWWDGGEIVTHSGSGGSNTNWTLETYPSLTASTDTTRLAFVEVGTADSLGMFLDAFSVIEISCVLEVDIDIKPGSYPNCFNSDGHGVIPVAILGSTDFDVSQIDPGTVTLEDLAIRAVGKSNKLLAHIEDVNDDGFDDLVVQIEDVDGAFQPGEGSATVTGELFDGTPIEGSDSICIRPPE